MSPSPYRRLAWQTVAALSATFSEAAARFTRWAQDHADRAAGIDYNAAHPPLEYREYLSRYSDVFDAPPAAFGRCPDCDGPMRLDRDPHTPLGDVLICNDCQRVVTR